MFAASSSTPDQRHREPATRGALGELLGGVAQRHRQRGHQARAGALAFLAVQVQRVARLHEHGQVQLRPPVGWPARGDPAGDVGVAQERQDLPGGAEHAAALLKRCVDVVEHRRGGQLEAVVLQDPGGLVVVGAR